MAEVGQTRDHSASHQPLIRADHMQFHVLEPRMWPETLSPVEVTGWCSEPFGPGALEIFDMHGAALPFAATEPAAHPETFFGRAVIRFSFEYSIAELVENPPEAWDANGASLIFSLRCGGEAASIEYELSDELLLLCHHDGLSMKRKAFPPWHLQTRIAGEFGVGYASFGDTAVAQLEGIVRRQGLDLDSPVSVLDFGCGPGRVVDVLHESFPKVRLTGTDIDSEAIGYCRSSSSPELSFSVNDQLPPLPYGDASFDLIYTISTFTHMPEALQFAWLAELNRVLKPGGILVATVHGPVMVDYIVNLYPGAAPLKGLLEEGGHVYVGEPRQGWPSYFGATTDGLPEHYKLAYHSHDYITREWSRFFDVREINVMALNIFQDAVVARRPIDRAQSFDAVALRADARRTVEAPRRSPSAPTGIRGALRTLRRLGR